MARYLGLEITDGFVKGVVLHAAYRTLQIVAVECAPRTAPGPEALEQAVRTVLANAGTVDATYSAMPGTEASLRRVEMPRAVYKRGGRVLANELEGALAFDVDEATIDASVIRDGDPIVLLAVAVRTERVRAFLDALRAGGGEPREVGVGSLALGELARELPALASKEPILIYHVYESQADFAIVVDGTVHMARTLTGQTTPAACERGIRQTVGAYRAAGGEPVTAAYLLGEGAHEHAYTVADALEISADVVQVGLPMGAVTVSPLVDPASVASAPLGLALAMRGLGRRPRVDLRKGDLAVSSGAQVFRERGWFLAGCAAAIVGSWIFSVQMRYVSAGRERDRLRTALAAVSTEAFGERVVDPTRARALAQGTGGGTIDEDPLPLADAFDTIGVLSARIATEIRHDVASLEVNDEHVEIQGLVGSLADRDRIVDALGHYECFQNVHPGRAQRNAGDDRQQYTLDIELRCPERRTGTRRGATRPGGAGAAGGTGGTGGAARGGT